MPLPLLLQGLSRLLAPPHCPGCDLPTESLQLDPTSSFCPACLPLLEESGTAHRPPRATAAALRYAGPLADAICRFKYGDRRELGRPLGQPLARAALAYAGEVDCVVPLPLHVERLRQRGFNQATLLARPVARALAVPLETGCLRRIRPTVAQAGLAAQARLDNVRAAFAATPPRPSARRGSRVLLIDDVRTTGATLTSAALALRAAGWTVRATLALAQAD